MRRNYRNAPTDKRESRTEDTAVFRKLVDQCADETFDEARGRGLLPTLDSFIQSVMQKLSQRAEALCGVDPPGGAQLSDLPSRMIHLAAPAGEAEGLKTKRDVEHYALDVYYRECGGIPRGRRQIPAKEVAEILRLKKRKLFGPSQFVQDGAQSDEADDIGCRPERRHL